MSALADRSRHGEVHLHLTDPDTITDPGLLARYEALLDAEERPRHARFRFAKHRHQFLVARALVRTTLSLYHPADPATWSFAFNEWGRPSVEEPAAARGLRFNLSHTDGLIAVLVAREREVGVDVEDTHREGRTVDIADRYFAPAEVAALRQLDAAGQRDRFFDLWTLKEAYIKARGMGLAIPLDQFAFTIGPSAPRVTLDPALGDDAASWRFRTWRPTARHRLSAAARWEGDAAPPLASWWSVPLGDRRPAGISWG